MVCSGKGGRIWTRDSLHNTRGLLLLYLVCQFKTSHIVDTDHTMILTMRALSLRPTWHHFHIDPYFFLCSPLSPSCFAQQKVCQFMPTLKILPFSSKFGLQIVKICNNILVEDGFAEFASSRELVRKCIAFRFARISSRYAGGLRESGNHATDP